MTLPLGRLVVAPGPRRLPIGRPVAAHFAARVLSLDTVASLTSARVDAYVDRFGQLWRWDAFKVRYVRTPAGVKRYGVPIGSPIPVGRRVKPKGGAGGGRGNAPGGSSPNRVQLSPGEKGVSQRAFGGDVDHGARINDRGELEVTDSERAKKRLDGVLNSPSTSAADRKAARDLRHRIDMLPPTAPADVEAKPPAAPKPPPVRKLNHDEAVEDYERSVGPLLADESDAVRDYTGNGYTPMNRKLRGQEVDEEDLDAYPIDDHIEALNGLIGRYTTPGVMRAFRSFEDDSGGLLPDDDLTGRTITMGGFSSTALDEPAPGFSEGRNLMEITIPKGLHGVVVGGTDSGTFGADEREFILPHNSRFRVDSQEWRTGEDGQMQRVMKVTVLPPLPPPVPPA